MKPITQDQYKEIEKFHNYMKKILTKTRKQYGIKKTKFKFASKMLLKLRPPWKGGNKNKKGGMQRANAADITVSNETAQMVSEIARDAQNAPTNNNTLSLRRGNVTIENADPDVILALQGNEEAIQRLLQEKNLHQQRVTLLRMVFSGITIGITWEVYHLFDNFHQATNTISTTINPVNTPTWRNRISNTANNMYNRMISPVPAPPPALPAPEPGMIQWMMNWVTSGGSSIVYRTRIMLAWVAEILNDLVGLGQVGISTVVFIMLALTFMLIINMYENGVAIWTPLGGFDTRRRGITLNTSNMEGSQTTTTQQPREQQNHRPPPRRELQYLGRIRANRLRRNRAKSRKKDKEYYEAAFKGRKKNNFKFEKGGYTNKRRKQGGHHLYKRLGISKYATKKQIRNAYKKLKKKKRLTKKIKYAYKILSKTKTRRRYNNQYKKRRH